MRKRILSTIMMLVMVLAVFSAVTGKVGVEEKINGTPTGWSDDFRLTNDTTQDVTCRIAVEGDIAHLIWEKDTTGAGGHYDIFYRNSTDAGNKWNIPIRLTNGTSGVYCRNPDLGISSSDLHVVWHDNDAIGREIKYCNSTDGGITWSDSKMISVDDGENSEAPLITVDGSTIHVVWIDSRFYVSPDWNREIYYVRSVDGGITWDDGLGNVGQERRLTNAIYGSGANGIVTNGSIVHMIFSDDRESPGTCNVYYKRSVDNGATWDDGLGNIDQDRKLTTNSTNHGPGAIAVNGSTIHVTWIDEVWPGPNYYMYYCNSTDNGATWNPIQLIVDSGTAYNPSIDVEGNEVHVVWDDWRDTGSTKEIYYKNSTDSGATWGSDVRLTAVDDNSSAGPKIAISGSHKHVTWVDQRDGNREIYYKRYPDFPQPAEANLTLNFGWNLISLPVEQPKLNGTPIIRASDIVNVTGSIEVAIWNATGQNYSYYLPAIHDPWDPENFLVGEDDAIFVWMDDNATYLVEGYEPGSQNVTLKTGWNMVAYKNTSVGDVGTLWAPQVSAGAYDDICHYDGQTFRHYIYPGTEMQLVPTRGYFVWSDSDTWLTY